jgi:chemotaxis protein MotB
MTGRYRLATVSFTVLSERFPILVGKPADLSPGRRSPEAPRWCAGAVPSRWELSAGCAVSIREIRAGSGVPDDRFASVAGKADTEPMFPDNPCLPGNRHVTVTLLKEACRSRT